MHIYTASNNKGLLSIYYLKSETFEIN